MMRHIEETASEVFRVVRTITRTDGSQGQVFIGPYSTLPSVKGACSVLTRESPPEWSSALSYDHHLERATLNPWEQVE